MPDKFELSVLVPGIRTENWETLYNSIGRSTKKSWEIIFVGPNEPHSQLLKKSNIKYYKDFSHAWFFYKVMVSLDLKTTPAR